MEAGGSWFGINRKNWNVAFLTNLCNEEVKGDLSRGLLI